jgi:N-methylhydantoinase B
MERDPAEVLHDVVEGWVTRERAAAVYGVAIDEAGRLDLGKSEALRSR